MNLIPPSFLTAVHRYARAAHVGTEINDAPASSVSFAEAEAWLGETAERTKDADIGLHFGSSAYAVDAYGLLAMIARSASTFGAALSHTQAYARLFGGETFPFSQTEAGLSIGEPPHVPVEPLRHFYEAQYASMVFGLRTLAETSVHPLAIHFPHPKPKVIQTHLRLFPSTELHFDAETPGILFPASAWHLKMRHADEVMLRFLHSVAQVELKSMPEAHPDVVLRIRKQLEWELSSRNPMPTLSRVAKAVALSERTLQRRLDAQNVSFRQLVDEARRDFALRLLAEDAPTSLKAISDRVGLEDDRSLRRAVKRWTGQSPSSFRRTRKVRP